MRGHLSPIIFNYFEQLCFSFLCQNTCFCWQKADCKISRCLATNNSFFLGGKKMAAKCLDVLPKIPTLVCRTLTARKLVWSQKIGCKISSNRCQRLSKNTSDGCKASRRPAKNTDLRLPRMSAKYPNSWRNKSTFVCRKTAVK